MDIQWHLRDLAQCAFCGADFRTAPRTRAARKILDGQALIDVIHVILLRIGNPVWVKRFAELMANLPNTVQGYSDRPAVTDRFDAMPLGERVSYIGKSSGRGVMRRLMEEVGGEALVEMLPDHIARICPDAAGALSSGKVDPSPPKQELPSLLEFCVLMMPFPVSASRSWNLPPFGLAAMMFPDWLKYIAGSSAVRADNRCHTGKWATSSGNSRPCWSSPTPGSFFWPRKSAGSGGRCWPATL